MRTAIFFSALVLILRDVPTRVRVTNKISSEMEIGIKGYPAARVALARFPNSSNTIGPI